MSKRLFFVVLVVSVIFIPASYVFADSNHQMQDVLRRLNALERENASLKRKVQSLENKLGERQEVFVESVKEEIASEIQPEITTAASVHEQEKEGWFTNAAFSWLKLGGLDDIDFAVNEHRDDSEGSEGEMYSINFGWEPAWKASGGYRFDNGNELALTYFGTRVSDSRTVTDDTGRDNLRATLLHGDSSQADAIDYARAEMKVDIDRWGVEFTHPFYENNKMRLTWGTGLNYMHIKQKLYVDYRDDNTNEAFYDAKVKNYMVGPRFATSAEYAINDQFSLAGAAGVNLMAQHSELRHIENAIPPETLDAPIDIVDRRNNVTPVIDAELGLVWRPTDRWKVGLAYEFMWMNDVHTMQHGLDDTVEGSFIRTNEDITLHGLSLDAMYTF